MTDNANKQTVPKDANTANNANAAKAANKKNKKRPLGARVWLIILCLALAIPSLMSRILLERANHSSLIIFDLLELNSLTTNRRQNKYVALMEAGISGFLAPECTAEEIEKGVIDGVSIYPLASMPAEVARHFNQTEGTVLILQNPDNVDLQVEYLSRRFAEGKVYNDAQIVYFCAPQSYGRLETAGVLPDLASMKYLSRSGVSLIYAPAPSFGSSPEELINSLEFICSQFPSVRALCPSGEIAAAYPNTQLLADFVKEHGLLMAQVEFSRQYGSARQVAAAWPNVVSLHGVDRAEVIKRNILRPAMLNRMFRAAQEREVRLLVLRLDPLRAFATPLQDYCDDVRELRGRLDDSKFSRLWPNPAPQESKFSKALAAVALNLLFLVLLAGYLERFSDKELFENSKFTALLIIAAVLLGGASLFVGRLPRLVGALVAGLLATEVSLIGMSYWKVPLRGAAEMLLVIFCGGLSLAAFFSTPLYMYKMSTFSGVKLSLLMPIFLVLLLDLRKREHPESLTEILSRSPFWGELVLVGGLALAALIVLLRSGNYGFVSGSEIAFRDWLERLLVARPRTKEFLIGYPSLLIWYYLKQKDYWPHWREVFRMGVALGASSAINSFCHFHTPLSLTSLRVFNGWWTGLLLGAVVLLLAVGPGRVLYNKLYNSFIKTV